jgi:GNAT superfamily N-acetyltransferase
MVKNPVDCLRSRASKGDGCEDGTNGDRQVAFTAGRKRIPVEQRAEAAVIAWMRHKTTGYDGMVIPRVRGKRREVRRMLARRSHDLLERYRRGEPIPETCPLRKALASGLSAQADLNTWKWHLAWTSILLTAHSVLSREAFMLPANYCIRPLERSDYEPIIDICKQVYPTETPYTAEELEDHHQVFPQGQFVAFEANTNAVAGVHFTLRLRMIDFHIDDRWDVLTAGGSFLEHNPDGTTLYGADIMVHPGHQHHGIAHALTDKARFLVQDERLWRMVGASRLPGYGKHATTMSIEQYVETVLLTALWKRAIFAG